LCDSFGVELNNQNGGDRKAESEPSQRLLFLEQPLILGIHFFWVGTPTRKSRSSAAQVRRFFFRVEGCGDWFGDLFMINKAALKRLLTLSLSNIFVR